MRTWAPGLLTVLVAATPAAAQNSSSWTIAEQTLEDGQRALVLSRQQPRGRAEYRLLHEWRRTAGVYGEGCYSDSSGTESALQAERLADARQRFVDRVGTGPCTFDPDILDGFDPMFARLEEMARATALPEAQAWFPAAAGYEIRRNAGSPISVRFSMADLHHQRVGEVEVSTWNPECEANSTWHRARAVTNGDLPARIAAARAAAEGQLRAALAECSYPGVTVEGMMAGFDEALIRMEAQLGADLNRR